MKFTDYIQRVDEGKESKITRTIENAKTIEELKDIRDTVFFKMQLPDKILKKVKKSLDSAMKEMELKEERIHSKDKRAIMGYIKDPKAVQYKMRDGNILKVKPVGDGVNLSFDKDNFELAMTITDIVDSLGASTSKSSPGNITITEI